MRLIYFLIISFFIFGCAKPNYQDTDGSNGPQSFDSKNYFLKSQSQNLNIQLKFDQVPNDQQVNSFSVRFFSDANPNGSEDIDQNLSIILWMPTMGHGSSPVKIEKVGIGLYKVTNVYFIMPGEWEIRLQLKETANVTEQIVQKITI